MGFRPILSSNSYSQNIGQINDTSRQFQKEQQVKVFRGPNATNAVIIGKAVSDKYGILLEDTSGVRRAYFGQHPTTGEPILAITKVGIDVIDELST